MSAWIVGRVRRALTQTCVLVADWLIWSLAADPYRGAKRDPVSGLWFVAVPNSDDGGGNVITCSYRIDKPTRTVTCDMITELSRPL